MDWNEEFEKIGDFLIGISCTHHVPLHAPGLAASALAGYYVRSDFPPFHAHTPPPALHIDFHQDEMNLARLVLIKISVKWDYQHFVSSKKEALF